MAPDHPTMSWRAAARRCLFQHPLLLTSPSVRGLQALDGDVRPRAVFLGVGLCVPGQASRGVPLDVLALLLAAEALRRRTGAGELLLLLADQHAWEVGVRGPALDAIEACWQARLRALRATFPALRWISARTLHRESEHQRHRRALAALRPYERAQVADLLTLTGREGRLLKVGWTVNAPSSRGDERHFDRLTAGFGTGHVGFVYGPPGRALRPRQPRMAPYVALDERSRLMLDPEEAVAPKLARAERVLPPAQYRATRNHYRRLAYAFSREVAPLRGDLTARLQQIVEHCTALERPRLEKRHVV